MTTRASPSVTERVLRCVPDFGSGETVRADEIAGRLGMRNVNVEAVLARALKAGRVVRVRIGDWQLAPKVRP